jgi:sulfur-oxidizing protein SoxY
MVGWGMSTKDLAVTRRRLLQAAFGGVLAIPPLAWAARSFAARPVEGFRAETVDQTLRAMFGDVEIPGSDMIRILAADLAENGAVVPIKIEAEFNDVESISIIATKNPVPLVAEFVLGRTASGFVATRIKLAASCDVIAVVETGGGIFQARKAIEVTIGGCGV